MITTYSGEQVEALAPIIISASRSTDIPAFYAKWFFNRLAKGYCVWGNPFNRRKMYVSFERCKAIVFWTKNPKPILPYLHELDRRGIRYYFQFTLNLHYPQTDRVKIQIQFLVLTLFFQSLSFCRTPEFRKNCFLH